MNAGSLPQALNVGLVIGDQDRREILETQLTDLGHTVVVSVADTPSFKKEVAKVSALDVVITNVTSKDTIDNVEQHLKAAKRKAAIVVINSQLDELCSVVNIGSVGGGHIYPERKEDLRSVLYVSLARYRDRQQAIEDEKAKAQAIAILMARHHISSYEEGVKKLYANAASYQKSPEEWARKTIEADKVMHPRRSSPKKKRS